MGLGAKGAAYATVLAQASSVLFSLIYIRLRDTGITLKLSCLRPNHAVFRELLRVGVPICMQDAFIQITFIILTIIANSRGLEQAAAVGIVEKLLGFFFLVPSSMLSAVSALAAQNLGAGKPDRARGTLNYALGIVITYGLAVGVLMQFFSPHVLSKFTTDAAVIAMGCDYMGAYIWDVTLGGIQFCYSGYFCAYGISIAAFIHNAVSSVTVRVPGAYLAVILWPETLMPMGAAAPIGSLLSIIICLFIIRWMKRHPEKLPGFPKVKEESP
jgi:Na+-driven multidrug efflux pump